MNPRITKETDLYLPVKGYLEDLGFDVYGEVKGCDLTAKKGDELVIVELKLRLNLDLILQGVDRLDLSENVYLAIPEQGERSYPKNWKRIRRLLQRLGLGLIFVRLRKSGIYVQVALEPGKALPAKRRKRTVGLLQEMELRRVKNNTGGSRRTKLMTAYREQALLTAHLLGKEGKASPKMLKEAGAPEKAGQILYANHYGWFIREEKGIYALSPRGKDALKEYRKVIQKITT